MNKLKRIIYLFVTLAIVGVLVTSCEREGISILDEVNDSSVVIEKITSSDELENLMKIEGYAPSEEFSEEFLYTKLRGCTNYPWESNSGCSGVSNVWPVSTNGSSNYLGGCMKIPLIDYFKISVNGQYYYVCAFGATNQDDGRYLLRARVSNGNLVVTNLTFWGDRIDVVLGIYNSNCTPITTSGLNQASAPLN